MYSLAHRHFTGRRKCLETLCRKTLENGMFTSRVIANMYIYVFVTSNVKNGILHYLY